MLNEENRRLIRPVKVLEDEHKRTVAREAFEEAAGGEIDLFARGLAVKVLEIFPQFSFHLETDEACDVGKDLLAFSRKKCGNARFELVPGLGVIIVLGNARVLPKDLPEGPVAHLLPVGEGPSFEPEEIFAFEVTADLRHKAGLAETSFAHDRKNAALAVEEPVNASLNCGDFSVPAHEG